MKKLLASLVCLTLCATVLLTACKEKETETEVTNEKEIVLSFTDDFEETPQVFEYHFSGDEATLVAYHPENAPEGEVLPTDIVLPEKPIRIRATTVEEPAVVDGKNVIIKKKIEVEDDKEYTLVGIEDGAFSGNTEITSVVIPDTVATIGVAAFQGCTALESVTLPASLEEICDFTFNGCNALTELNIPQGVTAIGLFAFGDYFAKIPWFEGLRDTAVVIGDGILIKYNGAEEHIILGDDIKSIAYYAFTNCGAATVTLSDVQETVDAQAFYRYTGVVRVPEGSSLANELRLNNIKIETYSVRNAE